MTSLQHGDVDSGSPTREAISSAFNLKPRQAASLYLSHGLSTWNVRTYEFAAVLFTAAAFPDTLLMNSIRGLSTALATLLLSPAIGTAIDTASTRLQPMLLSISVNRVSIFLACGCWLVLCRPNENEMLAISHMGGIVLFALAVFLGIWERLSGVANMLAMERDWIPALANAAGGSEQYSLTALNTVMRRIDLVCKLLAPIAVSALIAMSSTITAITVVAAMTSVSCVIELMSAMYVWRMNDRLRKRNLQPPCESRVGLTSLSDVQDVIGTTLGSQYQQVRSYFSAQVWIPSLALALLHFSALSYGSTFVTYLLNAGFSLAVVTAARSCGSLVEVSSTFMAPLGIKHLAQTRCLTRDREDCARLLSGDLDRSFRTGHAVGLARCGLWGINMQLLCLIPVVLAIWQLKPSNSSVSLPPSPLEKDLEFGFFFSSLNLTAITMFFFLSVSRLGLWVYDLTTQEITQAGVPAAQRSGFAGTETSFAALFELSQWILAAIISQPDQFRWIAFASFTAVAISTVIYAMWVRQQRGHLLHLSTLRKSWGCADAAQYDTELMSRRREDLEHEVSD